jgi:nucleoside-diphosphate-sugar epimerase
MRIVVTGATGFVGGAFIRRAVAGGHVVNGLVRPGSPGLPADRGVTTTIGTLASPPWDALVRFGPDVCVHAAWITDAGVYLESPENRRYMEESLAFLQGLLDRGVGHIVVLGTSAEYQASSQPLHETRSVLAPLSPYARAKHALRVALDEGVRAAGARLAWARLFQPYGVGEPAARLCSSVIRRLAGGERVTLKTPQAVRDWIHVDDVAAALLHLVERRVDTVINIGSGIPRTVQDMALAIAGLLGRPELVATSGAAVDRSGSFVADATRLRTLGWTPQVELSDGLTGLIAGLR